MSDFVISARNVRRGAFGSEPAKSRFLLVPGDRSPSPEQSTRRKAWLDAVLSEAHVTTDPDTGQPCGDITIFVHGFNTSTDELITRHRQFKTALSDAGYPGAFVSFDWPSADVAINYLEDRSDAKISALNLVSDGIALLTRRQFRQCEFRLHVVAHSMGAYVVRSAFDDADDRPGIAASNWTVSQVCFLGADVSSASLHLSDARSRSLYRHCTRLTNYQNPYDRILKLSNVKRAGVAPRAGRRGLPEGHPEKAINIDCGEHYIETYANTGDNGHSWYFEDRAVLLDIVETLSGEKGRRVIASRRVDSRGDVHLV